MEEDRVFSAPEEAPSSNLKSTETAEAQKYLLFLSGDLLFGAGAEYVVEIITNHPITALPLVPEYVRGIINLRGQIIPIVDIRLLLGQEPAEQNCIIILNINDTMVGILVDTVQRMLDVPVKTLLPSPNHDQQKLVSGMCSLGDGQTMLVFDCPQLLAQS